MRRYGCALRMMHTRYQWMRPCRATRAGTQAPPLPASIKPLCHATFLVLVHRRSLFRQSFLMFVRRQSLFRQPFLVLVRRRSLFRQPFLVLVRRRRLFRQPFLVLVHRRSLFQQPFLVLVRRQSLFRQPFLVFVRRRSLFRQSFLIFVHRRSLFRQPDNRLGVNGSGRPKHGSAANCLRQSEPWWPQRQQAVSRRWDGSSNRTCRRSR